jgi:two-component system, chemotaxis family, response regulator Rcp1
MRPAPEILLVEDSPADAGLVLEALAGSARGSHVHRVSDGEEAIEFLRRSGQHGNAVRPDLVVLDLNLPRKDGRAVLAEVKSDPDLHQLPIVVFTTSNSGGDITRSYELGANCYVSKPGTLCDFFTAVRSIEEFWFDFACLPHVKEKP